MTTISELHLLVHPDFDALREPSTVIFHAEQERLRKAWEDKVITIAHESEAALIHISLLDEKELNISLKKPSKIKNPVKRHDLDRINRWQDILQERYVIIPSYVPISKRALYDELQRRNLYISGQTRLLAFGEYSDACVDDYKKSIRYALGIPQENTRTIMDLSLSINTAIEISNWRRGKEQL